MNIAVDRQTNKVVGIDIMQNPLNIVIKVPSDFELGKIVKRVDRMNPEIQKRDENGNLLYKDIKAYENGKETFEERYYEGGKKPIKFKNVERIFKYVDQAGKKHEETREIEVPTEFEELEPVMIENLKDEFVTLKQEPTKFTLEEVLEQKYLNLLNESQYDFVLADMFLEESDLDITDSKHAANTGKGIVEILPNGQVKTKSIKLDTPSKEFCLLDFQRDDEVEMYLAGKKFDSNKITFKEPIESLTIKFINNSNKPRRAFSYAVGYMEVE